MMNRSTAAFEKILEMITQAKLQTRSIFDEIPGYIVEGSIVSTTSSYESLDPSNSSSTPLTSVTKSSIIPSSAKKSASCGSTPPDKKPGSDSDEVSVSPTTALDGKLTASRMYRSLDKRHIVILQKVDLEKPMNNKCIALLEQKIHKKHFTRRNSEISLVDYVPSEPKEFKHLRM